ncbi:hypothetical protein QBC40DRAFT_18027 [Triangularia verruculosa]|uniref:C3H1-type domain-containing protein n=1 Tax=Triangularia verruculosa TaxID=2587418 RepID=A0AAN7ANV3_9PEZI|nr:hypothetical protein QBC40DRAFT_18027 [Triangularia verruculosa]
MATSNLSEFRHVRTGSLTIPSQAAHSSGGIMAPMPAAAHRFDGSRSPPNTSHVPCKFFRQGACQAGNACPFSHDLSSAAENVCKYFAKGNCKFGPKCANIHVLPDGRRINYGKNGVTIGVPPGVTLGARVNPTTYHQPASSALTSSFMRADAPYNTAPFALQDEIYSHQLALETGVPTIDTTSYTSNPASAYGSPRDEEPSRFGLGLSPNIKGLSVLDAPLPASFDSNGISHAARGGPWPSSVPAQFGLDSPSSSLSAAKSGRTSDALKHLHASAFGNSHLSPSGLGGQDFGSSPPSGSLGFGSALGGDEYFGKRPMHSNTSRFAKTRMMSSSVPKVDMDWDDSEQFLFEEDYVPGTLANELLTPTERARRGSTTNTIRMMDGLNRESIAESCPPAPITKFGTPIQPSSPGRWGPLWGRQKDDDGHLEAGRSFKHASAFGHVGSPLRNSSLASAISSKLDGNTVGVSALTQQLRETQLSDDGSADSSPHIHPNVPRNANGAGVIGESRDKDGGLARHVSSTSIGSSVTGRFKSPTDEEEAAFVFSMDDDDDAQAKARKRASGTQQISNTASPLSVAWSNNYPTAIGNSRAAAANGDGTRGAGAVETVGGR